CSFRSRYLLPRQSPPANRLAGPVNVEHPGRAMLVRVALGQSDAPVGDDGAVPVSAAGRKPRDQLPGRGIAHVEPAVRVVDVEQAAGENGARPGAAAPPAHLQAAAGEAVRPGARVIADEDAHAGASSPDADRREDTRAAGR